MASDTLVISLLNTHLSTLRTSKFCLDGFPRRKSQAEALEKILDPNELELVILLDLPESVLLERITGKFTRQI